MKVKIKLRQSTYDLLVIRAYQINDTFPSNFIRELIEKELKEGYYFGAGWDTEENENINEEDSPAGGNN